MRALNGKKKVLIQRLEITTLERSKYFEIRVPANTKKITGITVTAFIKEENG